MSPDAAGDTFGYENRAQFYDAEYPETRDHGFLASMIEQPNSRVLIVPGGTGTTALALDAKFPDCVIHSVDIEDEMVAAARARFQASGSSNLVSVWGDMTRLEIDGPFDRVFVAREAFQMLPDDSTALSCLKALKRQLSNGGKIILDVANFDAPDAHSDLNYYDGNRTDGVRYLDCIQDFDGGHVTRHATQFLDPSGQRRFQFDYELRPQAGGPATQFSAQLSLRKYSLPALAALIDAASLSVSQILGNYDGSPFTPDSPRICCLLR